MGIGINFCTRIRLALSILKYFDNFSKHVAPPLWSAGAGINHPRYAFDLFGLEFHMLARIHSEIS